MCTDGFEIGSRPGGLGGGSASPFLSDIAEIVVTGQAEEDNFGFTAAAGDRAGASHLLNRGRGWEAQAVVAEFGQKSRLEDFTCAREAGEDGRIRVLEKEIVGVFQEPVFGAEQGFEGRSQESGLRGVGRNHVGMSTGLWKAQPGEAFGPILGAAVMMVGQKGGEIGVGELSGSPRGRKSLDERQRDQRFEAAKGFQGGRVIAHQDSPQAVASGYSLVSEEMNQANAGADLAGEWTVRLPAGQSMKIRAQQIGDQAGIAAIILGTALTKTPLGALDDVGVQNVDLGIAALGKEIQQQGMCSFDANDAILGAHAKAVAGSIELVETRHRMLDFKVMQRGGALIDEIGGMFTCTPINPKVYLHKNLLVKETWHPAAWIVQVFLLQRSQRNTFLTNERIDLEDDPQAALAALETRGLSLQVSQCRRGRLSQDWHPYTLSTPFSWTCIEYKLTGDEIGYRRPAHRLFIHRAVRARG